MLVVLPVQANPETSRRIACSEAGAEHECPRGECVWAVGGWKTRVTLSLISYWPVRSEFLRKAFTGALDLLSHRSPSPAPSPRLPLPSRGGPLTYATSNPQTTRASTHPQTRTTEFDWRIEKKKMK